MTQIQGIDGSLQVEKSFGIIRPEADLFLRQRRAEQVAAEQIHGVPVAFREIGIENEHIP